MENTQNQEFDLKGARKIQIQNRQMNTNPENNLLTHLTSIPYQLLHHQN